VSFDYSSWTYKESDGTATISVTMTGTPGGAVSVKYDTSDGTGPGRGEGGAQLCPRFRSFEVVTDRGRNIQNLLGSSEGRLDGRSDPEFEFGAVQSGYSD
jgi:hypothetical protein